MVDENGKRSVSTPPGQQHGSSYVEAASQMGSNAIQGMAPADKGWILASVVLMLGAISLIEITSYMEMSSAGERTARFITEIETNRSIELRRLAEMNKACMNALTRQSDRIGRKAAGIQMDNYVEKVQ